MSIDNIWGTFFAEIDSFLLSLQRSGGNASGRFAEYAIQRLRVSITCVARVKDQLKPPLPSFISPDEVVVISRYYSLLERLIEHLRALTIEWQDYLDNYHVCQSNAAYSSSPFLTGEWGRPKFDVTRKQLEYLSSMSFNWTQVANLLGVSRSTINLLSKKM